MNVAWVDTQFTSLFEVWKCQFIYGLIRPVCLLVGIRVFNMQMVAALTSGRLYWCCAFPIYITAPPCEAGARSSMTARLYSRVTTMPISIAVGNKLVKQKTDAGILTTTHVVKSDKTISQKNKIIT